MPRFAANLSMLFTEPPSSTASAAPPRPASPGSSTVPYPHRRSSWPRGCSATAWPRCCTTCRPATGPRASAASPACPTACGEFQDGVGQAIDYATALGCRQVNCLAGKRPAGVAETVLGDTLVDNLRFAAKALGEAGITLLVEPINTRDIPGFFLSGSQQTLDLLDAVEAPNTKLQYDIYHMQIMEGDLGPTLQALISRIGHVQVADNPGRHEPGTGEIHHPFLFRLLDALGYAGWVGAEYVPQAGTEAGLGWFAPYRAKATVAA